MSSPYVGEIRMFGGNFAPVGWMFCEGQLLSIAQYTVLFQLIGTYYGGDGVSTFALPDLRGRIPVHADAGAYVVGQAGGVEAVALDVNTMPAHSHPFTTTTGPGRDTPAGNVLASPANGTLLFDAGNGTDNVIPDVTLDSAANGITGGNQPHPNLMPYLCTSFIISLFGIFPSQA